jgi:CRISPR-associated protein Cmr4
MANYKRQRYLFMTLDPVHIGTGGYRLGRVDNSIVREPGTKIPKIPGTSLHGAARSYAAQLYETPGAAGQSHDQIDKPDENPVCYTFGYVQKSKNGQSNDQGKAYSGVVNIFDAHILFFPVHSMVGPVWVTTLERLEDREFTVSTSTDWNSDQALLNWERTDPLNLGWLMLHVAGRVRITPPKDSKWQDDKRYKAINRIVIVKDALFSQVVNSNLEVRTSVAIDPETGAANEGALFTYEAIPRATFLTAEVVLDDYRQKFPQTHNKLHTGDSWNNSLDVVKSGFKLIEWLGVGGMGTRGFGRMAIVGSPLEESSHKEPSND